MALHGGQLLLGGAGPLVLHRTALDARKPELCGVVFFLLVQKEGRGPALFLLLSFSSREGRGRPPKLSVWIDADRFEGTRELEPRGLRFFPWQEEGGRPIFFCHLHLSQPPKQNTEYVQ